MAPPGEVALGLRLLGGFVFVLGLGAFVAAVLAAFFLVKGVWLVAAPTALAGVGGGGLGWGVLLYLGRTSKKDVAGLAVAIVAGTSALVMFWVTGLIQHALKGWPGWPFHVGVAAGIVGLVVVAVRHQLAWSRQVEVAMKGYREQDASLLRPGETALVAGVVREAELRAPVSQKACGAWAAEILGSASDDWLILGTARSGARFELASERGTLRVAAASAFFALGSSQEQLPVSELPAALREVAARHGFFGACTRFAVRELRIDAGTRVSVLGTVAPDGSMGGRAAGDLLIQPKES